MNTPNTTTPTEEHPEQQEPPAANVIEALRRVIRDLPAIGKEGTGPSSQGSYKYRGIEQITKHAAPLFAQHGIVMAPNAIVWRPTREIMVQNKPNTDESLLVTYRVYGPGGVDDFIEVQAPGIGRDSSDKGSNKAMTAAFKYALTQMLAVADAKDDNDARHDDTDEPYEALAATRAQLDAIRTACRRIRDLGTEVTETNDVGEVKVLDVQLLARREDGELWAAISEDDATKLTAQLNGMLADMLLDGDGGSVPPTATPSAPVAPGTGQPADGPQAGAEALTQAGATGAAEQEAAAAAALGAAEPEPENRPCELCGSTRTKRVDVKGVWRCSDPKGCAERAAKGNAGQAGDVHPDETA